MRNNIILVGSGVLALNWLAKYLNVEYTDPIFWYMFVPTAVAFGLIISHRARGEKG